MTRPGLSAAAAEVDRQRKGADELDHGWRDAAYRVRARQAWLRSEETVGAAVSARKLQRTRCGTQKGAIRLEVIQHVFLRHLVDLGS